MIGCNICENLSVACLASIAGLTNLLRKAATGFMNMNSVVNKGSLLGFLTDVQNMFLLKPVLVTYCCCVLLTSYDALGFSQFTVIIMHKVMACLHVAITIAALMFYAHIYITWVNLALNQVDDVVPENRDGLVLQLTLLLFKHSHSYENMSQDQRIRRFELNWDCKVVQEPRIGV